MIKIQNLTYSYPNAPSPVLSDIDLEILPGEFVLLVGDSGAGKSTLLRTFNGLVPHFSGGRISGTVQINGIDVLVSGPQTVSQQVGFVFQNPEAQAVVDRVEPEIAFGLENAALPPAEMRLRVEEVLDLLDLTPLRDRPLVTLSGGERQRVAIASALALRPQVLVLDEPTSQLDPKSAEDVLQALVRLNQDLGLTVILAEHRLERVLPFVDRLVWLADGRIVADDTVHAVVDQLNQLPPLLELGKQLGWRPLPLTIKAGRRFAHHITSPTLSSSQTIDPPPGSSEVLLDARNVQFAYDNNAAALNKISLQVGMGEIVALMGRNGSGKTTLLRGLVNLLNFSRGEVVLVGQSTTGRSTAEICQSTAYLPQNPDDLLFAETVRDELLQTLHNHKMTGVGQDRIDHLLDTLGLTAVANTYPRDLSVGQRQRVALAAVMITQPKLLLLDEPTRGLDYQAKDILINLWRRWQTQGMGLLLVTHDVELVAQVADRVVVLSQGEIIASGPTAEVLTSSPLFSPQIAKLFPGRRWLTVQDVLTNR